MEIGDFDRVAKRIKRLQSDKDQCQGELNAVMEQLLNEFDCETLEEAEHKLEQLESKLQQAERKCDKAVARFDKKWKELIDEAD